MVTSAYVVEKGIPVPFTCRTGSSAKYPFNSMEIGESFGFKESEIGRIRAAASMAGTRLMKTFSVSEVYLRCWRVK